MGDGMSDWDLLREYVDCGSESAFQELVTRYAPLVCSAAARQLGESQLAQDVTQSVFGLLAQKAHRLNEGTVLVSWLYRTACFLAADVRRAEKRRRKREQMAATMRLDEPNSSSGWQGLAPLLDQAIAQLNERDRQAVLLRFFQHKEMREVGTILRISEAAAKMRVSRAVEKLRQWFSRRDIALPAGALGALLWENSVQAVPSSFLKAIGTAAMAKAGFVSTGSSPILWLSAMTTTTKIAATGTALVLLLGIGLHLSFRRQDRAEPALAGGEKNSKPSRAALVGPTQSTQKPQGRFDAQMARALAALRTALFNPVRVLSSTKLPLERVDAALQLFGADRKAAIPLLMEALSKNDPETKALASHGLETLGAEAADVTPRLLEMLAGNQLTLLNDEIPKLFLAIHPTADLIPKLVEILGSGDQRQCGYLGQLVAALAQGEPAQADAYRKQLTSLLSSPDREIRLQAASILARYPGPTDEKVVGELRESLKARALEDPHFYDPIVDTNSNTTFARDREKFNDNMARFTAVGALMALGPTAKQALPDLATVADQTADPQLRNQALAAIETIDPERRVDDPDAEQLLREKEQAAELVQLIKSGHPTVEDLVEALKHQDSAGDAALAIRDLDGFATESLLPDLRVALERWGSDDIAQVIRDLDPESLVGELKHPKAAYEAALALGDLGSAASFALPALYDALENGPERARGNIAKAIEAIDPGSKPLFQSQDLKPAVTVLFQAADQQGQDTHRQVADLFIKYKLENFVTQGKVVEFVQAVEAVDPKVGDAFVTKLAEKNPQIIALLKLHRTAGKN
jgi:RNA polymerase sigma factor (sigma-70 family)